MPTDPNFYFVMDGLRHPITASCVESDGKGHARLSFVGDDEMVTIVLPPHMAACAAMIVEAFNAHMNPPLPAGGAPTSRVMGLAVALANLPEHHDDYAAMHAVEGHDGNL